MSFVNINEKFRIRETLNLSTNVDSRTDTILEKLQKKKIVERLRDFSHLKKKNIWGGEKVA